MAAKEQATRLKIRERRVYDNAHVLFRAGVLEGFYYGRRSPTDPTPVWMIDGVEYPADATDEVASVVDAARDAAGIDTIEVGATRDCGYRSLTVRYRDGRVITRRFDAVAATIVEHAGEVPAPAVRPLRVWGRVKVADPEVKGRTRETWALVEPSKRQIAASRPLRSADRPAEAPAQSVPAVRREVAAPRVPNHPATAPAVVSTTRKERPMPERPAITLKVSDWLEIVEQLDNVRIPIEERARATRIAKTIATQLRDLKTKNPRRTVTLRRSSWTWVCARVDVTALATQVGKVNA